MGRINIELPEELHQNLRIESATTNTPIKHLVVQRLEETYSEEEPRQQRSE